MTRNVGANSAGRVFHILSRYLRSKVGGKSTDIWLDTLAIPSTGSETRDSIAVTRYLDAIMRELDVTAKAYKELELPDDLFKSQHNALQHALQVELLHHPIGNTKQYLGDTVMLSLRWWSIILPDDDFAVAGEDMVQLKAQIDALEDALSKEGIPPGLRSYASNLLSDLRAAMLLTVVEGSKPLRSAMRKAVSDAHFEEDNLKTELAESAEKPEVRSVLSTVGAAVKTMANIVGDTERLSKGYGYLLTKATDVGEVIAKAISSAPGG